VINFLYLIVALKSHYYAQDRGSWIDLSYKSYVTRNHRPLLNCVNGNL